MILSDQSIGTRLLNAIAERHFLLWLLDTDNQGFILDLQQFVRMHPWYAADGWENWRTVQVAEKGSALIWSSGVTLSLKVIQIEMNLPPGMSWIQPLGSMPASEFYRPLRHCVAGASRERVSGETLMKLYRLDNTTFRLLAAEYAAPRLLLYGRLYDLFCVLAKAYAFSDDRVRDLLHWSWQRVSRRHAQAFPTPLIAIQNGELLYVEDMLYRHRTAGYSG